MTTPDSPLYNFLREICESPNDDFPRLKYADWLDENDRSEACLQFGYEKGERHVQCARCHGSGQVSNGFAERSKFIRTQIALAELPTRHLIGFDKCPETKRTYGNLAIPHGEGYWTLYCRVPLKVGDRIDLLWLNRSGKKMPVEHGLLVTQVREEDYVVKKDAESIPDNRKALRERERELFKVRGPKWFNHLPGQWRSTGDDMLIKSASGHEYKVERGFISEIHLPCSDFMQHAEALFDPAKGGQPIVKIVLSDRIPHEVTGGRGHTWLVSANYARKDTIPRALARELVLMHPNYLATQQLALDAISDACVRYGRIEAGLKVEERIV